MAGPRSWEDSDFMPEVEGATRKGASRFAHVLLVVIAAFIGTFIFWASRANLDEVTRGQGSVIPSGQIQVVQNLEGGIVSAINVREGAQVEPGQVLLKIDNVKAASDYRESYSRYLSLAAAVARMEAEVQGKKEIKFPKEVLENAAEVAARERDLFESRRQSLDAELDILRNQVQQREQEVVELESRLRNTEQSYQLAIEEKEMLEPMVESGVAPQIDLMRIKRQVNDLQGDADNTRNAIPRAKSALQEARRRIEERKQRFRSETLKELNEARSNLSALEEVITAEKDKVTRTEVRSPVRGTVKTVHVNTIGGVVRPGEDLVEIVPIEETLLVEARIRPKDVAFLRPGLPATVKITAYDFSIYGGLKATLEEISADTITDEQGEKFYRIRLRTERNYLGTEKNPLPIIPGMTASVDILTGEKTVLDYLMKPILKAREVALRER